MAHLVLFPLFLLAVHFGTSSCQISTSAVATGFRLEGFRVLDPNSRVHFQWGCNEKDPSILYFQVEYKGRGYIGIGFNDREKMQGADMVLGWIDDRDGTPTLEDRFGTSDSEAPVRDREVNVRLLMAYENATHTVFRWSRAADTKDEFNQDYIMRTGPLYVLWSFTEKDPEGAVPAYHDQRGSVRMNLYETSRDRPADRLN